jgi:hypothetical protein
MSGAIDSIGAPGGATESQEACQPVSPGPLFKEIYAGLIDVEDRSAWGPLLEREARSFLAHTTDIQTLDQFKTIHQTPEKRGTAFHHRAYVATLESLQA